MQDPARNTDPEDLLARWRAGREPTWSETLNAVRRQIDLPAWPPRTFEDGVGWVMVGGIAGACLTFVGIGLYRVAVGLGLANW